MLTVIGSVLAFLAWLYCALMVARFCKGDWR